MRAEDVLREMVHDCDLSQREISKRMGRSHLYVASYVSKKQKPNIELMAEIGDVTGHDLLIRNRRTGREIIIDPPEKEE